MWGMPGSMLAAIHMAEMTQQSRWHDLFETQAALLLADLEDTPQGLLWIQDLYGERDRWLGPVHGFAGNSIPLLRGWNWLTPTQQAQVAEFVPNFLRRTRGGLKLEQIGAREARANPPRMCQHCHGAPGIVTTLRRRPSPPLNLTRFCWMPVASLGRPDPLPRAQTFATARVEMVTHSSSSTATPMTRSGSTAPANSQ